MASRVAGKIKLQSVDELLGVPEIAGTQEIEIGRIHAFPNHPFKVLDDEKMDTLVDSIRENGILNPVIVRPDQSGNYEMISGHRRLHAAKIVGLKKVPAIVKEMSDDEAIIKMVDTEEVRKLVKRLDELDPIPLPWESDEEALKDFWDYCEERQREERIIAEMKI